MAPVREVGSAAPGHGSRKRIGILALQGAFEEHEASFDQLPSSVRQGFEVVRVRKAEELDHCDALVIPGGESTTMKIIGNDNSDDMMARLGAFVHGGAGCDGEHRPPRPVWGTCAGCILLSDDVVNCMAGGQAPCAKRCKYGSQIGGLNVSTCRNFFGRQEQSFEAEVAEHASDDAGNLAFKGFPAVFIRAPAILETRDGVRVLARVRHPAMADATKHPDGVIVAAESDRILVTTFHPELCSDARIHQYFAERFVLSAIP